MPSECPETDPERHTSNLLFCFHCTCTHQTFTTMDIDKMFKVCPAVQFWGQAS
jgi:hypothetical protein